MGSMYEVEACGYHGENGDLRDAPNRAAAYMVASNMLNDGAYLVTIWKNGEMEWTGSEQEASEIAIAELVH